ncbi:MAG: hypothetical protein M3068_00900 [Gemmatimonadota bacterium]|nr:hypothetical protein [Gemmatimonadota bacterium]
MQTIRTRDAATRARRMGHITARLARRLTSAPVLAWCVTVATVAAPAVASAQWSTAYAQFYFPGKFNWTFRRTYPAADRLFNAFDYGHAILYERLYNDPHAPTSQLEQKEYDFITKKLLVSPPRLPLEEAAIEVAYAKIAPEAKMMFDWAHLLHRQVYDVLSSENMPQAEKDARIAELVGYYKTRPDLAFSSVPKNMELMEGQPYSLAFRQRYPKFNGLIWGYHWLQVGLYEPLMTGATQEERQAGVAAAVTRFRQMLENAPEHMPRIMPMTAAIAPTFAKRYQEAAIIFDNLHAMHDVVSDILTNDKVPHNQKRAAILEAASRYRDNMSFPLAIAEWASMGQMMGVENMGGPAVGILPGWPPATLPRGASMLDAMKNAPGMAAMKGMAHVAPAQGAGNMAGMNMAGMNMSGLKADSTSRSRTGMQSDTMTNMPGMAGKGGMSGMAMSGHDTAMMKLHEQMMRDPVIRKRVMADTAMRRMMSDMKMDTSSVHDMPGMNMNAMKGMKGMKDMSRGGKQGETKAATKGKTPASPAPAKKKKSTKSTPGKMKDMKNMPGMKP